jgi:hypothetical protein
LEKTRTSKESKEGSYPAFEKLVATVKIKKKVKMGLPCL